MKDEEYGENKIIQNVEEYRCINPFRIKLKLVKEHDNILISYNDSYIGNVKKYCVWHFQYISNKTTYCGTLRENHIHEMKKFLRKIS